MYMYILVKIVPLGFMHFHELNLKNINNNKIMGQKNTTHFIKAYF